MHKRSLAGRLLAGLIPALLAWLAPAVAARADTVILVQGYLGSAGSWRASGIAAILHRRGWRDAGHLSLGPYGVHSQGYGPRAAHRFYTIDLPTEAPVALQANMLSRYLAHAQARHRGQPIVLVGHSAGGVVARFAMVTGGVAARAQVRALITIASPHMGTQAAELGSFVANSPLSWVAPFFGAGTVNRSRTLYRNLSRERPGNLLGWLNRQPHPPALYVSVVRIKRPNAPAQGDSFVHGWSQDMNTVPALRGRARLIFSPGDHGLRAGDGHLLANILAALPAAARRAQ